MPTPRCSPNRRRRLTGFLVVGWCWRSGLAGATTITRRAGLPTTGRGRRLEELLEELKRIWSGEERGYAGAIGPTPAREGGPELIVGGHDEAALRRAARFGDGWIMGGGTPEMFAQLAAAVDQAWQAAGRSGKPRKLSLAYFALGPRAREQADAYMKHYYGWLGEFADQIAASAAVSEEMVRGYVAAFEQSGCDELIMIPSSSELDQVALLAQAVK
jgi:alkanesulfonate monooxygenase SsuD/methylene tetrahydromethanopterin reductase-like flavin-dependent oxidoreductase (luciferase family)